MQADVRQHTAATDRGRYFKLSRAARRTFTRGLCLALGRGHRAPRAQAVWMMVGFLASGVLQGCNMHSVAHFKRGIRFILIGGGALLATIAAPEAAWPQAAPAPAGTEASNAQPPKPAAAD